MHVHDLPVDQTYFAQFPFPAKIFWKVKMQQGKDHQENASYFKMYFHGLRGTVKNAHEWSELRFAEGGESRLFKSCLPGSA